jgi:cytochrome c oxidase cbb3-type subunit I/II
MPPYAFLLEAPLDLSLAQRKLEVLRDLGHPYDDAAIQNAVAAARTQAEGVAAGLKRDGQALSDAQSRSEAIALIAYLQRLGKDLREQPTSLAGAGAAR